MTPLSISKIKERIAVASSNSRIAVVRIIFHGKKHLSTFFADTVEGQAWMERNPDDVVGCFDNSINENELHSILFRALR